MKRLFCWARDSGWDNISSFTPRVPPVILPNDTGKVETKSQLRQRVQGQAKVEAVYETKAKASKGRGSLRKGKVVDRRNLVRLCPGQMRCDILAFISFGSVY